MILSLFLLTLDDMNVHSKRRDFIVLNVGHAVHHADWNWKNISSPFARIHLVESGSAEIVLENKRYKLREGHLYLTPPYTAHSYSCSGDLNLYYIHIYEALKKELSLFDILDFPVELKADEMIFALVRRLVEINPMLELPAYNPKDYESSSIFVHYINQHTPALPALEMETEGILRQIVARFLAHASDTKLALDERILQAILFIHSNIHKPIKIEELAECSCLTKDHFIRLFKKQMQCTPGKYINQKKVEQAQLMMLVRNISIKELAYELGFENVSYFNRLFKKIAGENPGRMQRRIFK